MVVLRVLGKMVLRILSDCKTKRDIQRAPKRAYDKTGDEMKNGKKNNKYVNGRTAYRANLKNELAKANKRAERRLNAINDI